MTKSLDLKLSEVRANRKSRAFIIADAKDADMAFGVRAPGPRSYLGGAGARLAQFSPEIWAREEFGSIEVTLQRPLVLMLRVANNVSLNLSSRIRS